MAEFAKLQAKHKAESAERWAKCEVPAEWKAALAQRGLQRAEDHRLAELWRARELAEPVCVCVCGKCRKGGVSPLASPLGSRSVATFNAKV